jgi:hypothetical protein
MAKQIRAVIAKVIGYIIFDIEYEENIVLHTIIGVTIAGIGSI